MSERERKELLNALADYILSEGCRCCQDIEKHKEAEERLGKLLKVPKYSDGSGRDFARFRTQKKVKP